MAAFLPTRSRLNNIRQKPCIYCRAFVPWLHKKQKKYPMKNLAIVLISASFTLFLVAAKDYYSRITMRYFIYTAQAPLKNGGRHEQMGSFSSPTYPSLRELQVYIKEGATKQDSTISFAGEPVLYLLQEVPREDYLAWNKH